MWPLGGAVDPLEIETSKCPWPHFLLLFLKHMCPDSFSKYTVVLDSFFSRVAKNVIYIYSLFYVSILNALTFDIR